jgi:4-amino-4-deoxy-L-arabinose transferase-like glycosyltransferase
MKHRVPVAVGALLALALAARLAMLFTLEGKPLFGEPILDSAAYDRWAQEIAGGNFWGDRAFYQDPLYPYGLGLFYKVVGRHLLAVKVLQALLGVAGLWCLFEGARRLAGTPVALATLALGAVYRTTAFYDVVLLKEFLGPLAIEAAFLFAGLAATSRRGWWWGLAGAALGLGALVRGNLLVVAPAAAVALFFLRERRGAAWLAAGAALAVLPCTLRNAIVAREFVVTTAQAGPNLYIGNNPDNWTGRYRAPAFLEAASPDFEERDFRREAQRRLGKAEVGASEASAFWRGEALAAMRAEPWGFAGATFRRSMLLLNDWEVPDNYSIPFARRWSWALALP